ncbi:MAG: hypothetical protein V7604_3572 [Hyphomicrobiales bacterium]
MSLAAERGPRTSLRCGAVPCARVHHAMSDFYTVGIIDVACERCGFGRMRRGFDAHPTRAAQCCGGSSNAHQRVGIRRPQEGQNEGRRGMRGGSSVGAAKPRAFAPCADRSVDADDATDGRQCLWSGSIKPANGEQYGSDRTSQTASRRISGTRANCTGNPHGIINSSKIRTGRWRHANEPVLRREFRRDRPRCHQHQ